MFYLFIILLVLTIPAAHMIGALVAHHAKVDVGHIREAMPSLPATPPMKGREERRWDKRVAALEKQLLERFKDGATALEAYELAAQLGEEPLIVDAVLTHMREEIPCRMRIMQSGKIYHDFSSKDIAALQLLRAKSLPRQLLLFALAAMANVGAAWPFLSTVGIATVSLYGMATAVPDERLFVGVTGLIMVSGVLILTWIMGWLTQFVFTPIRGPRLGDVKATEKVPKHTVHHGADGHYWGWVHHSNAPLNTYAHDASSSWGDVGRVGGGALDLGDADEDILVVLVVVLLLAILAASLSAVWVWIRGMWRAIKRLDEPQVGTSPTMWVRTANVVDKWEKYIPTNDLVIRTLHALKRFFDHRRPQDEDLAARVLILARKNGGVISALEIALHEGLDMNEAHEVGSRLCGMLGGRIMVSEDGELVFAFPKQLLSHVTSVPDKDMWSEYIAFNREGDARRREKQDDASVPVNLVGLTKGHLLASDRLVAGTYVMALMGIVFFSSFLSAVGAPAVVIGLILAMLVAMALGTSALNATARYTSREAAAQGIRRDIRRAAFKRVMVAIKKNASSVRFEGLAEHMIRVFGPSWKGMDKALVQREIRSVVVDLDLDVMMSDGGKEVYDINALCARFSSISKLTAAFEEDEMTFDFSSNEQDEVVFDTQIEHDHVTVLGRV